MLLVADNKILRVFSYIPLPLSSKYTESSLTFAYANPAFSSVAQLCPTIYNPIDCSTPGFPVLHQFPELAQTNIPNSCRWCHPTILSSVVPFSSCLQSFPASGSFPMSQFFNIKWPKYWSFNSASVLPINIQDWFPLDGLVWSCSPRDSEESSPTAQFKSVNSLALSFLYRPTLTSIRDYWKKP